jgi:hypothetical protein
MSVLGVSCRMRLWDWELQSESIVIGLTPPIVPTILERA